jgi:hypothetical protein
VAEYFSRTTKDTIYRITKQLVNKGWFIVRNKGGHRKNGTFESTQYMVVSHTDWVQTHNGQCRVTGESSSLKTGDQSRNPDRTSPENTTGPVEISRLDQSRNPEQPVEISRTTSLGIQTYSSKDMLIERNTERENSDTVAEKAPATEPKASLSPTSPSSKPSGQRKSTRTDLIELAGWFQTKTKRAPFFEDVAKALGNYSVETIKAEFLEFIKDLEGQDLYYSAKTFLANGGPAFTIAARKVLEQDRKQQQQKDANEEAAVARWIESDRQRIEQKRREREEQDSQPCPTADDLFGGGSPEPSKNENPGGTNS